jgi:hypothetical protein
MFTNRLFLKVMPASRALVMRIIVLQNLFYESTSVFVSLTFICSLCRLRARACRRYRGTEPEIVHAKPVRFRYRSE